MKFLVPEQLESQRLYLRQFRDEDWQDLHEYFSDELATKFTFGRTFTEGETWRSMCSYIGHWHIRGYGPYAVQEKASGKVAGMVGFWYPHEWPEPEIMWALSRQFWGQGIAKEAASLVHKTGRKYLPDIALISLIHKDNKSSIGLARSIGASFEKSIDFRDRPHSIYRHKTTS